MSVLCRWRYKPALVRLGFAAELAGYRPQFVVVTLTLTPISMASLALNNKMLVFAKDQFAPEFLEGKPRRNRR